RMGLDTTGMHVHHKDENPLNNQRDNLELKTPSQHTADHNRTRIWPTGNDHGNSRFADDEILARIEMGFKLGWTQKKIAQDAGMSEQHLGDIFSGTRRPSLKPEIDRMRKLYNWKPGNQNVDDAEMLQIIEAYL